MKDVYNKSMFPIDLFPYKEVFSAIESRLLDVGSENISKDKIIANLNEYKNYTGRTLQDNDYFRLLVFTAFYSGFRAQTVTEKKAIIEQHFPSLDVVSLYKDADVERIMSDPDMISHKGKICSCIENAKKCVDLIQQWGSIKKFIDSFSPLDSLENLLLLKETLEFYFQYLGGITAYHFLTDIGLPVLKPDRVICRLFSRLGLLEDPRQLLKTVLIGRKFAENTALPIRYIDIVLVSYGQVKSDEFGIEKGICLEVPRCDSCSIGLYCAYVQKDRAKNKS
ncbi:MAG: DNA-3-methyladenine glycosylase I [Candidatus Delongbacteria bacterium]